MWIWWVGAIAIAGVSAKAAAAVSLGPSSDWIKWSPLVKSTTISNALLQALRFDLALHKNKDVFLKESWADDPETKLLGINR